MTRRTNAPRRPELPTELRPGVVLRTYPARRGEAVLTLLGPQGKYRVVSRAGRTQGANLLALFNDLLLSGNQAPGEDLWVVSGAELQGALPQLRDPLRFALACVLCEATDAVIQDEEPIVRAQYDLFVAGLRAAGDGSVSPEPEDAVWPTWVLLVRALQRAGLGAPRARPGSRAWADEAAVALLDQVREAPVRSLIEARPSPVTQRRLWQELERFCALELRTLASWSTLDFLLEPWAAAWEAQQPQHPEQPQPPEPEHPEQPQ